MSEPALSPEEWEKLRVSDQGGRLAVEWAPGETKWLEPEFRHSLAARCLHEQPFGFTRKDARHLRRLADTWRVDGEPHAFFSSLAARIEALLPPEEQ